MKSASNLYGARLISSPVNAKHPSQIWDLSCFTAQKYKGVSGTHKLKKTDTHYFVVRCSITMILVWILDKDSKPKPLHNKSTRCWRKICHCAITCRLILTTSIALWTPLRTVLFLGKLLRVNINASSARRSHVNFCHVVMDDTFIANSGHYFKKQIWKNILQCRICLL